MTHVEHEVVYNIKLYMKQKYDNASEINNPLEAHCCHSSYIEEYTQFSPLP